VAPVIGRIVMPYLMLVLAAAGSLWCGERGLERVRSLKQQMLCPAGSEALIAGISRAHTKISLPDHGVRKVYE
jgi:hypothetical protein